MLNENANLGGYLFLRLNAFTVPGRLSEFFRVFREEQTIARALHVLIVLLSFFCFGVADLSQLVPMAGFATEPASSTNVDTVRIGPGGKAEEQVHWLEVCNRV